MNRALTILHRLIALPFFMAFWLFGVCILFIKWTINFIRFGGEAIAYTKETQRKTINDVFNKLIENENKN